ncbi:hypothetical protein Bhyg_02773 [Pseudolycoriella hygida]|uniref:Uncharacterized protein n=1 Tax=Pseudolycoriella hygida TaxID=35572 RepID=A0A9Q0NC25_9DIPT|nr:hypothetical protein Bhyg_02773 [Pseudolycoriella hygida]
MPRIYRKWNTSLKMHSRYFRSQFWPNLNRDFYTKSDCANNGEEENDCLHRNSQDMSQYKMLPNDFYKSFSQTDVLKTGIARTTEIPNHGFLDFNFHYFGIKIGYRNSENLTTLTGAGELATVYGIDCKS